MAEVFEDREAAARERLAAGDLKSAATLLVRGYGPEIYGFLVAHLRDETAAADVFSAFTEDLWRGLPRFEGRSTLRVWAYAIAKNAAARHLAAPHRRRRRNVPLSQAGELAELADAVRTETHPYLRTEAKSKLSALRDRLSPDERALLVLRVDRGLDWLDVARILFTEEGASSDDDLKTGAARARKRFQSLKEKIRRMAKETRLLE
ncbi:MAG TPA: sigma-70 family RNA polymerase sigma factor [Polyangiaceae bacterium]|nr:sigma-70 family RNA polymerase sigma factor [Polyangiaceae bacterium]